MLNTIVYFTVFVLLLVLLIKTKTETDPELPLRLIKRKWGSDRQIEIEKEGFKKLIKLQKNIQDKIKEGKESETLQQQQELKKLLEEVYGDTPSLLKIYLFFINQGIDRARKIARKNNVTK